MRHGKYSPLEEEFRAPENYSRAPKKYIYGNLADVAFIVHFRFYLKQPVGQKGLQSASKYSYSNLANLAGLQS